MNNNHDQLVENQYNLTQTIMNRYLYKMKCLLQEHELS
jgi:hypothetical protein